MGIINSEGDIMHSLMHADEEIYPPFETPQEELAYLEQAYPTALTESQQATEATFANKGSSATPWRRRPPRGPGSPPRATGVRPTGLR